MIWSDRTTQPRPVVVVAMREPVTLSRAAALTGKPLTMLRELVDEGKVSARACMVNGRRTRLFELWEIEAAIANRRQYRRRRVAARSSD